MNRNRDRDRDRDRDRNRDRDRDRNRERARQLPRRPRGHRSSRLEAGRRSQVYAAIV